jgi:hypothetical protein
VGPSSIADASRQNAVAAARVLLRERTVAFVVLGVSALVGAAVATLIPSGGHTRALLGGWLLLSAVGAGWLAYRLFPGRGRSAHEPGLAVNVVDQHTLYEWAVDLSHRVGVSPPGAIRLAPASGAWIDDLEGDPALVIGAGSLGWLTTAELERVVGIELATLRVRDDDVVLAALRLSRSLEHAQLTRCAMPVIGGAVRLLGRRVVARSDKLRETCVAWALEEAPVALTPTDNDMQESVIVDEAWDLLNDRWLTPAVERGLALDSIAFAHRELLGACEDAGLIERGYERDDGPAALALLADPDQVDVELALWAAAQLPSGGEGLVGWDDYSERVLMPTWRQSAADALSAASRASGHAQPPTLETLVKALESEKGVEIGSSLLDANRRRLGDTSEASATDRQLETALSDAVAQVVCLALAESGRATPRLDLLWGVSLCDDDGEPLDVEQNVRKYVAAADLRGLRWYLKTTGLELGRELSLVDAVVSASLPPGKGIVVWRGWKPYDVVVTDTSLRAYRHGPRRQIRGIAARLTGASAEVQDLDPDLAEALERDLADQPRPQIEITLADVVDAELYRTPRGTSWSLRVASRSDEIRLNGLGDAHAIAQILDPRLGDRLQHTGLSLRPNRSAAALGKVGWYTIWGGVFVLLAGAVGLVQLLDASGGQADRTQAVNVVLTFGVFGAALIAIGLVPYRFIARRGHEAELR